MANEHIHFVTGKLAEHSLKEMLPELAAKVGFSYSVSVLPITVAALMTPDWIARKLEMPADVSPDRIIIPGYCGGDLSVIETATNLPVECGPRNLRQLPRFFNQELVVDKDYGKYRIEILAEINHCPRLKLDEILAIARQHVQDGANIVDLGCDPGHRWLGISDVVSALRAEGIRVSVDSLNVQEISDATHAGAELVLSVNSSNRDAAADWGVEVVAIPDLPSDLSTLDETVNLLESKNVAYRLDPILEPIGFGFASSLKRYMDVRQRYPNAAMMMGIGNLTELTDVDSAGINVMLLGICEELNINSVLTTQVIPWAKSSVKECDLARRLVHYSVQKKRLPKHVDPQLVMLRDTEVVEPTSEELDELADNIKDTNYRIYTAEDALHLVSAKSHLQGEDPFLMFSELLEQKIKEGKATPDASHAFYLGFELCKAAIAETLSKQYQQDEALDWGFLTKEEVSHRLNKSTEKNGNK